VVGESLIVVGISGFNFFVQFFVFFSDFYFEPVFNHVEQVVPYFVQGVG